MKILICGAAGHAVSEAIASVRLLTTEDHPLPAYFGSTRAEEPPAPQDGLEGYLGEREPLAA